MKPEILHLNQETLTLMSENPADVGAEISRDIQFPPQAHIDSLTVNGKVTDCVRVGSNGSTRYQLQMNVSGMSSTDKSILAAYVDFAQREDSLNKIMVNREALYKAFDDFSQKIDQLVTVLDFLVKKSRGNVTLH